MQKHPKGLRPIDFESHRLTGTKSRYRVHEIELLAIRHYLRKWRAYLEGKEFVLRTNNNILVWSNGQANLSCSQAKWVKFLAPYPFLTVHIASKDNVVANALYHLPKALPKNFGQGDDKQVCLGF